MRPLVVAVVVALGVLAAALTRLGDTLAQLRTLELPVTGVAAVVPEESRSAEVLRATPAPAARTVASEAPVDSVSEHAPASAASGDEHLMRALAADAEFQRAAAELLQDPDPAVQAEARQLMRDLGQPQSE